MTISIDDLKRIDLRVAEILSVKEHPSAARLYVLTVRVGEEVKQIVAGIRDHYSPEELEGKKIVVVNNLQPATIRGEESSGMLLAAGDKNTVVLLAPDKDIPSGAEIR